MALYQWGTGACGCIDGAGNLELPDDGALVVNPDPAASGAIRLPNGAFIKARNAADTADIELLGSTAADHVQLAGSGASLASIAQPLEAHTALGRAAESGSLRLPNNAIVRFRDDADEQDFDAMQIDDSGNLLLGGPLSGNRVNQAIVGAAATVQLYVDSASRLSVDSARAALQVSELRFGQSVASPMIIQESVAGTASPMTIQAQSGTGAAGVGGDLVLRMAGGPSQSGKVELVDSAGSAVITFSEDDVRIADGYPFFNLENSTWKKLLNNNTRVSTATSSLLGELSFDLEPGNYTFRVHLIVQTPASNNGGLRVGGGIASGGTPTNVSRLGSIIRVNSTSSSIVTYQHSTNMTGDFGHALATSATFLFVAEGAFSLTAASVYEVRTAQNTSASGATTYRQGSYAMFNKCSN